MGFSDILMLLHYALLVSYHDKSCIDLQELIKCHLVRLPYKG